MPIAIVQQKSITTISVGVVDTVLSAPVTAGNSVVVLFSDDASASFIISPRFTDGGAEVLSLGVINLVSGLAARLYYAHNLAGNEQTLRFRMVGAGAKNFNLIEVSGLLNAVPENTNVASASADPNPATGSVTPASAANLLVGLGVWTADNYSSGPTNSFTRLTQIGGGSVWQETAALIQAAATPNSTAWTLGAALNWASLIAAFGGADAVVGAPLLTLLSAGR